MNKYLKYKSKYLQLKNQFGAGIDASYIMDNGKLRLNYMDKLGSMKDIIYTVREEVGSGSFGVVNKLVKDDDGVEFILKKGNSILDEGIKSDLLKDIIDEDMLVLFQGNNPEEFLIAKYNGKDLEKEYFQNLQKIKNEFNSTITQILQLLSKINKKGFYHNDIKLQNITIKNKKVYLIDFGLLGAESKTGTIMSNSIYSIIPIPKYNDFKKNLVSTDIFGFFYVCIDLLCYNITNFSYKNILLNLLINDKIKLFNLYYYILPEKKRIIKEINDDKNLFTIFDNHFPKVEETKKIFGGVDNKNINLFRFMTFIYKKLENIPELYKIDRIDFINFLKILSDCLLPNFNYDEFIPKFKDAVNKLFKNNLENGYPINSLAFNNNGDILAIGTNYGIINLWRISEDSFGTPINSNNFPEYEIVSLVFHPSLPFLATSYSHGTNKTGIVKLFKASRSEFLEYLIIDCMIVFSVRFNLTGTILATSYYDGTVKLWTILYDEIPSFECIKVLDQSNDVAKSIDFNSTGNLLASGYDDGIVKLWCLSSDYKSVNLEKYSEDEKKSLEYVAHQGIHPDTVMYIAFCQIYPLFSIGYSDGMVKIWKILDESIPSAECVQILPKHNKPIRSVIFHPKLPYMANCYDDNIVNIWKISADGLSVIYLSCIELFTKSDLVKSIAFHPTKEVLVTGSSDSTAKLWHFLE
jgi:WD40 repeat protein